MTERTKTKRKLQTISLHSLTTIYVY